MSKEKKRSIDESTKKETLFYYEIIGVIIIVFSITVLGKFGKIGIFFTTFFKCSFGDWYWFFILSVFFLGIYNLFFHQKFNFKSNKFIGFVFIGIGLLVFAHFPLHNYAVSNEGNYFSNTWEVYERYMDYGGNDYLGGGLIGAVIFYGIYYLLGIYGVILVATLIILLGISLVLNKTVLDIFKIFTNRAKKIGNYTNNFRDFFKYELGKVENKVKSIKKDIFSKEITLPIKLLDDFIINTNDDNEKNSVDNKNLIQTLLSKQNVEYKFLSVVVSYKVTTYKILLYSYVDIKKLIIKIQEMIVDRILFSKENGVLTIQIPNAFSGMLTLKEVLLKQSTFKDNYIMGLGIDLNNEILEIDISKNPNFLLAGSVDSGIRSFVYSFVFMMFFKVNLNKYTIKIFDNYHDFTYFNSLLEISSGNVLDFLDNIINEINRRNDLFKKHNIYNFIEYNRKIEIDTIDEGVIKRKIYIINHINLDKESKSFFENKIMYINQNAQKVGINIIFVNRNDNNISSLILSVFENKIFFRCDDNFSTKLLGNDNYHCLLGDGDAFFKCNNYEKRIQIPLITKKEIEKCIEYIKK